MHRNLDNKSNRIKHKLVGRVVAYNNRLWRVAVAHRPPRSEHAWLTLRSGWVSVLAKDYEVELSLN